MTIARALSVSLILSTALTVGACKGGDKGGVSDSSPAKALKVENVTNSDIEKLFADSKRKVKDSEAETALGKLGLSESNTMGLSWKDRKGKAGNYVYSDLTAKGNDGEMVTVDKLELTGVHMEGESASFDTIKVNGMKVASDDGTATIDRLDLSGPSPALAAALTEAIGKGSSIKDLGDLDLDIDLDDEDMSFDAFILEGAKITSDEGRGNIDRFAWGEVDDSGKGIFSLEGLNFDVQERNKPAVKIKLASANARGIDIEQFKDMSEKQKTFTGRRGSGFGEMFSGSNPFGKSFDAASFKDFSLEVDTLSIRSDGGQGIATKKGSVTTIRQVLQPLTVKFSSEPEDRDVKQLYKGLQTMGYDELTFSTAQTSQLDEKTDTLTVRDSYIDMKDGFRLSYGLEASGLAAMSDETLSDAAREAASNNVEVARVNFALEDKSIMDRAFKFAAEKQGSSPSLLKMQAKGGLMFMSSMAKSQEQQQMAAMLSKAVTTFIDDGGTLKIGLEPKTPISAAQLQKMNPSNPDVAALGFYAITE